MKWEKMKRCSKCKVEKSRSEFGRNRSKKDGLQDRCKVCRAEEQRTSAGKATNKRAHAKWSRTDAGKVSCRKNSKKHKEKFPEKIKAENAVNNAIRDGKLIRPSHCEDCGKKKFVQGHHWSYKEEHWLDVEWLCMKCHRKLHRLLQLKVAQEERNK